MSITSCTFIREPVVISHAEVGRPFRPTVLSHHHQPFQCQQALRACAGCLGHGPTDPTSMRPPGHHPRTFDMEYIAHTDNPAKCHHRDAVRSRQSHRHIHASCRSPFPIICPCAERGLRCALKLVQEPHSKEPSTTLIVPLFWQGRGGYLLRNSHPLLFIIAAGRGKNIILPK